MAKPHPGHPTPASDPRLARPAGRGCSRRALLGLALAAGLPWRASAAEAPATAASGTAAPAAAAPQPFRTLDLDPTDSRRERAVPLRLYLPEGDAPVPLVVFSHGIGGSRLGYSYLGQHLASQGVACLHVQHVGSDRSLWAGNPLMLAFRLQNAARDAEAVARVRDLRFALDHVLTESTLKGRLDAQRILAAGHSYGANTAMLAAGARVYREGLELPPADDRLRALLLLSAPPFYGEPNLAPILGPVTLPALHVTTTEDVINVPGYHSPASDRIAIYQAMGSRHKALAVFDGGPHSIFTDRAGPGGSELNGRVKQATRDLALAFARSSLAERGPDRNELSAWRERYTGLLARFEQSA